MSLSVYDNGGLSIFNALKIDGGASYTTIMARAGYLRIGDAGTTSHTFNTNDDLLVSGRLEVDGISYFDDTIYIPALVMTAPAAIIQSGNTDNYSLLLKARDNSVGTVEIARLMGAADPYFQVGRDDTGVALNSVTDGLVLQMGGGTGNESAGQGFGISIKLGNAASEVEERASIDTYLETATNGAEDA